MKTAICYLVLSLGFTTVHAQKYTTKDTLKSKIEEVVITGQYGMSTIKKSLHKVEVITKEDIQRMSQNSVAEVLNQNLNILIIPERNSGNSKANIMGLGANYTKILVDNIPLIGDEGLGSNIDLTKINLDDVERIEIVKGSMGVEFGGNAMAGVINIITKNTEKKRWNVRGFIQEETVGKEYNWIDYGKGKHIQSLGFSHNLSPHWFANLSLNRSDFQGFWGESKGKNHFQQDNKRGYEWQPKEQLNATFNLRFHKGSTKISYKVGFLSEEINFYNPSVTSLSLGGGKRTFIANDIDYHTIRWLNHLNISSEIFSHARLNLDFSHQKQTRDRQNKVFEIPARAVKSEMPKHTYSQSETLYSKGSISNFLKKENLDIQLGYEMDQTKGYSSWETGQFDGKDINQSIFSGGLFASGEITLNNQWFLRPGIRYNFSNLFKTKPNFSLVIKNLLNEKSEFRATLGTSNRNPNFEELFTYFVDNNHNIQGNPNLIPEVSYSGSLYYTISGGESPSRKWSLDANTMYLQVRDKIHSVVVSNKPLQYKYINVDNVETWITNISGKIKINNLGVNAGAVLVGKSQRIYQALKDQYRYSTEYNASVFYEIPKTQTTFTAYYKGVGSSYEIMEDKSLGVTQHILTKRNAFSLIDASISQKFWKNRFILTIGIRNLLDYSHVRNSISTGGAHSTGGDSQMMFYGRSYFGRVNFNF